MVFPSVRKKRENEQTKYEKSQIKYLSSASVKKLQEKDNVKASSELRFTKMSLGLSSFCHQKLFPPIIHSDKQSKIQKVPLINLFEVKILPSVSIIHEDVINESDEKGNKSEITKSIAHPNVKYDKHVAQRLKRDKGKEGLNKLTLGIMKLIKNIKFS